MGPLATLLLLLLGVTPPPQAPTLDALRAKAQERMRQDLAIYSEKDLRDLEDLYQSANKNLRAPESRGILEQVVSKYPKSNRAGSAVLYLAQMTSGDEREKYLKEAIANHGDSWYGDGVQVGAFARAQLAVFYSNHGRAAEAQALAKEVVERFPGAVDHSGRPLVDMLRKLKLL
jgi:hypothetical protein